MLRRPACPAPPPPRRAHLREVLARRRRRLVPVGGAVGARLAAPGGGVRGAPGRRRRGAGLVARCRVLAEHFTSGSVASRRGRVAALCRRQRHHEMARSHRSGRLRRRRRGARAFRQPPLAEAERDAVSSGRTGSVGGQVARGCGGAGRYNRVLGTRRRRRRLRLPSARHSRGAGWLAGRGAARGAAAAERRGRSRRPHPPPWASRNVYLRSRTVFYV